MEKSNEFSNMQKKMNKLKKITERKSGTLFGVAEEQ